MNMQPASAHALVVGITQYQHVRPLPRVADAEDVASVLRDPATCGYPAGHVMLLQEAEASRARILDALDELARHASADSTALIYFSGHGGQPIPIVREPCEASFAAQMLVHLDMTRDEKVVPRLEQLVRTHSSR